MIPNKIIIHHSAGQDHPVLKDFNSIKDYHVNVLKHKDIDYHWVIESVENNNEVIQGRPEWMDGAHCYGQNTEAIGICLVGDYSNCEPTEDQYNVLVECIKDIYTRYGELPIYGHSDFYNTACPGMVNIDKIKDMLKPQEHWAKKYYNYLNDNGLTIHEERFDDGVTRGELFALLARQNGFKDE